MAVRRRRATRRRSTRRRRNPIRGVGTLVLNPRRRRRRTTRRRASSSRRRRTTRKRRNPVRRRRTTSRRRRTTRRRRNALVVNRRRRRSSTRRRRNPARRRRRSRARAPRVVYRYRSNPRRKKRRSRRRRNPSMGASLKKIPVIGGLLSSMAGFVGPALAGVLGVEPTMMLAKFLGPYVPMVNSSLFYALAGLGLAAVAGVYLPVSPSMRKQVATGIASAAGGVAYYKWRTGMQGTVADEMSGPLAGLDYGFLGDGGAYSVVPFGDAGALAVNELAGLSDVLVAPDAMSALEINTALAGPALGVPRRFRKTFGRPRFRRMRPPGFPPGLPAPSEAAFQEGHRFMWLIRLLGPQRFQQFASLPPEQQQQVIQSFKQQAMETLNSQLLAAGSPDLGAHIFAS